jgi:hypothetical protein
MKRFLFIMACVNVMLMISCQKSDIGEKPVNPPSKTVLKTNPGQATGNATSFQVNAATGATISSPDGGISVKIPAGALAKNETITIQPITNTSGIGTAKAYRILPHLQFTKPVELTLNYKETDVSRTSPDLLRIAFQDSTGRWRYMKKTTINHANKKLSVSTEHFSDWTIVPLAHIEPFEARIGENESLDLRVFYSFDPDDLAVPIVGGTGDLNEPFPVGPQYIKKWELAGEGELTPDGNKAIYKAPVKAPAINPVAVSVTMNFNHTTTYILVSDITILSDFHIDYLQVNETEINNSALKRGSQLYIYGNFGNDPGNAKRGVKIGSFDLNVTTWSPKVIICDIPAEGANSSGEVLVHADGKSSSKLLNEWTVELNYAKKESPDGALTRKIKFKLRLRGDAIDFGSGDTDPVFEYTDLNIASKAIIDMPRGSFSNSVENDACGTYRVEWAAINGHVTERSLSATGNGLVGRVFPAAGGFGVKLIFESADILKSTRSFTPCIGDAYSNVVNEPIVLDGFHEETFWFEFATQAARSSIKAGDPIVLPRTSVAPGLYWDVEDLNMELFNTKLWWNAATPKYD